MTVAEYIEREAALNFEVDSVLLAPGALQPFMDGMAFYADHIKRLPAADVAPVRNGRWEWDGGEDMHYYCSRCHHNAYGCTAEILDGIYRYCPHCGALMDKDGDGE